MTESIHYLTGAYAVDAVDDLERARFEAHLRDCEDCREEIASLRIATIELGTSAAAAPPPELRAAVLEGITRVRPLPPLTAPTPAPAPSRETAGHPDIPGPRRGRGQVIELPTARRWRFVAAAAAVLAVASLSWAVISQRGASTAREQASASISQVQEQTAEARQVKALLEAPDLKMDSATDASGVVTTVYRSSSLGTSAAMFSGLPNLPAGKQFEAWNRDPAFHVSPAGVFDAQNGRALHMLTGQTENAEGLAVTIEAAGGAPGNTPLGQLIAQVPFTT